MSRRVSVVVPVYNEEEILTDRTTFLQSQLSSSFSDFEIILSENGSVDGTKEIIREQAARHSQVVAVVGDEIGDYGRALIDGINTCRFDEVAILEIDYLDLDFLRRGYNLLNEYDLVIGSKKKSPGIDQRPCKRKLFSSAYNMLLRLMFHIPLTETHGLKVLRKSSLLSMVNGCATRHAVYPSELVIRAWMDESIRVCEIPLTIPLVEIRTTRITAAKRLRKTIQDLMLLRQTLRSEACQEVALG